MAASTEDGAAGKNFETQRGWLFVRLERRIDGALELAQKIETKEHGQEGRLSGKERTQAEVISSQFVLEFVNAALNGSSTVVIAPDFQRRIGAIGDKDPEHIAGQVDELTPNGRLCRLELFAHNDKASRAFPIPKFEAELAQRVGSVQSLPLRDLIEPALEISRKARHDDVRQSTLFQKAQKLVGVEARIGSYRAHALLPTQQIKGFAQKLFHPLTSTGVATAQPGMQNKVGFGQNR